MGKLELIIIILLSFVVISSQVEKVINVLWLQYSFVGQENDKLSVKDYIKGEVIFFL